MKDPGQLITGSRKLIADSCELLPEIYGWRAKLARGYWEENLVWPVNS